MVTLFFLVIKNVSANAKETIGKLIISAHQR